MCASDPHELKDLSTAAGQRGRIASMTKRLTELQAQVGDTLVLKVENPQPAEWQQPSKEELNRIRERWKCRR